MNRILWYMPGGCWLILGIAFYNQNVQFIERLYAFARKNPQNMSITLQLQKKALVANKEPQRPEMGRKMGREIQQYLSQVLSELSHLGILHET